MKRVTYIEIGLVAPDEILGDLDPTQFVKVRFRVEGEANERSYYSTEAVYPRTEVIGWLHRWFATNSSPDKPATTLEPPTNA